MANHPGLLTADEKLKSSFFHSVSKICCSVGEDNSVIGPCNFNTDAIEFISEIIFKKLELYGEDLEAFCKNRKQSTINVEDVKLLTRRNPNLNEHVSKLIDVSKSNKSKKNKKPKATKSSTGSTSVTTKPEQTDEIIIF